MRGVYNLFGGAEEASASSEQSVRMLRFRWSRLSRHCGDGATAIDEANIGAAPWRWRTGRLNRRDGEMDDGSSSGEVDEGCRAIAVDDVVEEEAPTGQQ